MHNLFLRLYVASKVRMTDRPESGFVTAEHLAIAVAGVVIVGAVAVLFKSQLSSVILGLITDISNSGK
ncbi:MAG: hypothetical protein ACOYN3_01240 [Acidimicrobiia bacterium]